MPLRVRLGLVFALGAAAVIAMVGVGFLLQLRVSLDASLDAGLRARADAVSQEIVTDGVRSLRLTQDEDPVQVLTAEGRVVVTSPALGAGPVLDAAARQSVLTRPTDDPLSFTAGHVEERTRYIAVPLRDTGQILVVGTETDISDAADEHVEQGLLLLGPIAVLVAGVGGWWLAGEALRPVENMRRQAAAMTERDDGAQLAVPRTRDELAALATTMNAMLDGLRDALRHERSFVADAGHELRTPLATLRAELELAARPGRDREELQAAVDGAAEETDRIIRLAEDLLLLARGEDDRTFLQKRPTDLGDVVASAAQAAAARGRPRAVTIDVDAPDEVRVDGDPDRLRQALDNVLANAVRHSPDDAAVTVTLREAADGATPTAVVTVADRGAGFPPDFLPHAFERFRRADTARARTDGGTGLGLAIVDTIVRAHHGRVRAANQDEGGALVELVLPRGEDHAAGMATGPRETARRAG